MYHVNLFKAFKFYNDFTAYYDCKRGGGWGIQEGNWRIQGGSQNWDMRAIL